MSEDEAEDNAIMAEHYNLDKIDEFLKQNQPSNKDEVTKLSAKAKKNLVIGLD